MTTINPTTGQITTGTDTTTTKTATKANDALGKDDFLKLLVTQLKYQDPTKPMEDKEFISQMAQFSSLEQMTNVSDNLSTLSDMQAATQSAALVGRSVELKNPDGDDPITGTVTKVQFTAGKPQIMIGDKTYPLTDLLSVS